MINRIVVKKGKKKTIQYFRSYQMLKQFEVQPE